MDPAQLDEWSFAVPILVERPFRMNGALVERRRHDEHRAVLVEDRQAIAVRKLPRYLAEVRLGIAVTLF
jgi:hypothetical protein